MDPVSSDLLARLQTPLQTIANDADPKMMVISQRYAKYINKGSFLTPKTVRTGNSLGRLDITVRREDKDLEPSEYVMIYIENGYAKVATLPYVNTPDDLFEYQYTIGPASSVACDFDGRFEYIASHSTLYFDTSRQWALVTFGEPYFALVHDGCLTIYHGNDDPLVLASSGVTRVSLIRGWKSVTDILTDQGFVCAYVKYDGKAYYRNYCEQTDGSYSWDYEREITVLGSPISDLSVFRTADYRLGFIVEKEGIISWAITHRSWSGMAMGPENITANLSITSSIIDIYYRNATETEYLSCGVSATTSILYAFSPVIVYAENIDDGLGNYGIKVKVLWDEDIFDTSAASFTVTDAYDIAYSSQLVEQSGRELTITFVDFNNAVNPCKLNYIPGVLRGDIELALAQSFTFDAAGLIPTILPEPVCIAAENTDARTIILTFDIPVVSPNLSNNLAAVIVSADEYNRIPDGQLVENIYADTTMSRTPEATLTEDVDITIGELTNTEVILDILQLMEDI